MTDRPAVAALRRIKRKCAEMRLLAPDGVQPHFWRELMGAFETQCAEALASPGAALEAPPQGWLTEIGGIVRREAGPLPPASEVRVGDLPSVNIRHGVAYSYCPECGTEAGPVASGRGVVPAPPPPEQIITIDEAGRIIAPKKSTVLDEPIGEGPDLRPVKIQCQHCDKVFDWVPGELFTRDYLALVRHGYVLASAVRVVPAPPPEGHVTNAEVRQFVKLSTLAIGPGLYACVAAGLQDFLATRRAVPAPQEGPRRLTWQEARTMGLACRCRGDTEGHEPAASCEGSVAAPQEGPAEERPRDG